MRTLMPGGGRRYSEETMKIAWLFIGLVLLVFFALLARVLIDRAQGKEQPEIDIRKFLGRRAPIAS